jgi:mannose-1-phosphate guanylyltransferase
LGIKITLVKEDTPLGTAGCIANCRDYLYTPGSDDAFFVLNADVTCSFPFAEMLGFHNSHDGLATMLVKEVDDWSKYGVVIHDEKNMIQRFVEKPKLFVGNKINAGIYLFETDIFDYLPNRPSSIEKEVFPKLCTSGDLYAFTLDSFWCDLGQPRDYISGTKMYLEHIGKNSLIDQTATTGGGCIFNNCVIGPNCIVEDNVKLQDTVLLEGSRVRSGTFITGSIIGWQSTVGRWCHLYNTCVLGQDVTLEDGVVMNNTYVLPHKSVSERVLEPNKIIM